MKVKRSQLEQIRTRSFVNCHAMGVDSILLDDTPGARIRVFIARKDHELWKNSLPLVHKLSVGLHPHHCDITLSPVFGNIFNIVETKRQDPPPKFTMLYPFIYRSAIAKGSGKFIRAGILPHFSVLLESMLIKESWRMEAKEIHTIYVEEGKAAAWFVHEHEEDPDYQPFTYSDYDLEKEFDFSPLYKPMTMEVLMDTLSLLKVEIEDDTVPDRSRSAPCCRSTSVVKYDSHYRWEASSAAINYCPECGDSLEPGKTANWQMYTKRQEIDSADIAKLKAENDKLKQENKYLIDRNYFLGSEHSEIKKAYLKMREVFDKSSIV